MSDQPASDASPRPTAKVLVVEDDQSIGPMLKEVLLREHYEVVVAEDGHVASELLFSFSPDLILLDLHLPQKTGFDLLKDIRKKDHEFGTFTPVIILTGVYTSRQDKVTSLNAGADDFISKPFDMIELLARVRSLLRVQELYKRSQFLATHDSLTRCYNRRYLVEFLNLQYERFKRYKERFSYLVLDLDNFKPINDEIGQEAGDQLLMKIGFLLHDFFRAVDCIARTGGDEFAVILPGCSSEEAGKVAGRLLTALSEASFQGGLPGRNDLKVSFSVGIAAMPEHTKDKEELMRMADRAMLKAKKAGRNQFKMAA